LRWRRRPSGARPSTQSFHRGRTAH